MTQEQAARFLVQATYGPTMAEIDRLAGMGPDAWLAEQFGTPSLDRHWDYVARKGPQGCNPCDSYQINAAMESFWLQAVRSPDQLRQRVVLALSEIFVVSTINSSIDIQPEAHASYLDMLARNSFGNFRTLLEDVARHPTMGHYLSHFRNEKEDAASGRLPDENFAREVMQLFSIGLWELNPDGTRKKDANGNDVPAYTQADVMGMAKVMTGWGWGGADASANRWHGWPVDGASPVRWDLPMQSYPAHHSASEKRIVRGVVIAPGSSGEQSLKIALDTLFDHPNVGPFIGSQLIKRLVTANPSPAYVSRVAAAFNNNGAGVRGDMKAVLRAVLLDSEARDPGRLSDPNWGKLREPLVRYANFMRAFDVKAASGKYRIWNLEDPVSSIGQNPLRAPSVFNWFTPSYAPPGAVAAQGLVAPEFQISHETTVTGYVNFVTHIAERETQWWRDNHASHWIPVHDYLAADYSAELALASTPAALVDRLNLLLLAGRMSAETRQVILEEIGKVSATQNGGFSRVALAVALSMIAPDFIVQK